MEFNRRLVEFTEDNWVYIHRENGVEHKDSLIWLHGLGDSALGFYELFMNPQL